MKLSALMLSVVILTGAVGSASAQVWGFPGMDGRYERPEYGWDGRQDRQEYRNEQRYQPERLTRAEAREVRRLEARLDNLQRRANVDGVVTRREEFQINRAQRQLNRYIYRVTHNRRYY